MCMYIYNPIIVSNTALDIFHFDFVLYLYKLGISVRTEPGCGGYEMWEGMNM